MELGNNKDIEDQCVKDANSFTHESTQDDEATVFKVWERLISNLN